MTDLGSKKQKTPASKRRGLLYLRTGSAVSVSVHEAFLFTVQFQLVSEIDQNCLLLSSQNTGIIQMQLNSKLNKAKR